VACRKGFPAFGMACARLQPEPTCGFPRQAGSPKNPAGLCNVRPKNLGLTFADPKLSAMARASA